MNDDAIRSACSRAEDLISSVKNHDLRRDAFKVILQALLSGSGDASNLSKREIRNPVKVSNGKVVPRLTGLKSRISGLVDADFFAVPRSTREVGEELKVSGWNHKNDEISARLLDLVRARVLRRTEGQRNAKKAMLYSKW